MAILSAMGFDAQDESAAEGSLSALEEAERARIVEPVCIRFEDEKPRIPVHIEPSAAHALCAEIEVREESGERHGHRRGLKKGTGQTSFTLSRLPAGVHDVRVRVDGPGGTREASQTLVIAPRSCLTLEEVLGRRRCFGLWTSLYTVRDERGFGIGDFTTLGKLVEFAGEIGAGFIGINPLHALRNEPPEISPYGPTSRLFRNPIYLDVEAVPELEASAEARRLLQSGERRREIELLRSAPRLDYARIAKAQGAVLRALHAAFARHHRGRSTDRGKAFARFCDRQGAPLVDFATFAALENHFTLEGFPRDWRTWPDAFRDPRSEAVRRFRDEHGEEVEFHTFVQFELDRQLANAAAKATRIGLPLGLYQDLAVGTAASGFDLWGFPAQFVRGIHIGAPPDDYSEEGQDWELPPLSPRRLAEHGYRYWTLLLRSALEHSGALRIDHIMGLFRQFWIPAGRPATEGAYVRFPARELLALLCLESRRQGAVIIGEDLGTVPTGLQSQLARYGVLSSRVLLFERERSGSFRPSSRYSRRALVTANTHDLPPVACYWRGRDLDIRRSAGAIESDAALRDARARREQDRRALMRRLVREGVLPSTTEPVTSEEPCAAVYAFLCRSPAPLLGVSLDDLARETEPVNVPGVRQDRYPSWTRRMRLSIEELRGSPSVRRVLAGLMDRRVRPGRASGPLGSR
jgi:4-alpha-glucanotransferase